MAELAGTRPAALAERVAAVRAALAAGGGQPAEAVEPREAASVAHLGLTARVVAPYLAHAATAARLPAEGLRLADLFWQPRLGGPFPLSLPRPAPGPEGGNGPVSPEVLAAGLTVRLLGGPVRELVAATASLGVSPHILWGNTASAVHSAARLAAEGAHSPAGGGPQAAERARRLGTLLLQAPALARVTRQDGPRGFRRRTCCLIYRAAPGRAGSLCGDCALDRVPARPA
jgi:hypothetical protein